MQSKKIHNMVLMSKFLFSTFCSFDMFRTSPVHHQERFVQAVFADLVCGNTRTAGHVQPLQNFSYNYFISGKFRIRWLHHNIFGCCFEIILWQFILSFHFAVREPLRWFPSSPVSFLSIAVPITFISTHSQFCKSCLPLATTTSAKVLIPSGQPAVSAFRSALVILFPQYSLYLDSAPLSATWGGARRRITENPTRGKIINLRNYYKSSSIYCLSYDSSTAFSKTSSQISETQCFVFQFTVSSLFLKVIR